MGPSHLLGIALFAAVAQALAYPGPRATEIAAIPHDSRSPRPTLPASLKQLRKRQSNNEEIVIVAPDNTCGYVNGQEGVYT